MRLVRLGAFLGVLAATTSSPAFGATAGVTDGVLEYVAASGEANSVTVTRSPDAFRITDLGAVVAPGAGCSSVTPNQVECSARGVERLFVNAADLNDFVTVSSSTRTRVRGGGGDDILEGGEGDDDLIGNSGADLLKGGTGIDAFYPGLGADTVSGGTGFAGGEFEDAFFDIDLVFYWWRENPVTVRLDDLPNDGEAGEGDNVMSDVEVVIGGAAADTLIGNELEFNALVGRPGGDELRGEGGEIDFLLGGYGRDLLHGAQGFDALFGGPDADRMLGGDGRDLLRGGDGDDFMRGHASNDVLFGQRGNDTLVGGLGRDRLFARDGRYDEVFGSAGRDRALVDRGLDLVRGVESVDPSEPAQPPLTGRSAAGASAPSGVILERLLRLIEARTG